MTVRSLLSEMSAVEFAAWMAYFKVDAEKWEERKNGKGRPKTPEEEKAAQEVFELNVKASMERKGMRARKMKIGV